MNENKLKFMREVIKLLPMTGKNLTSYSKELNWCTTKLYDFRNGQFPSESQYNYFFNFMLKEHRFEMAKIMAVLNVSEEDIYNLEDSIKRYFDKIDSENKVGRG